MERVCSLCHAVVSKETQSDWCPACGGALVVRTEVSEGLQRAALEVDHRGIVLPRRHALGGVIRPQ